MWGVGVGGEFGVAVGWFGKPVWGTIGVLWEGWGMVDLGWVGYWVGGWMVGGGVRVGGWVVLVVVVLVLLKGSCWGGEKGSGSGWCARGEV